MSALRTVRALLRKELVESVRTWRGRVLVGVLLVFGVLSPLLALFMPAIVGSAAAELGLALPDPAPIDAAVQWANNLTQVGAVLVAVVAAGTVNGEERQGTAALVLAKPVGRTPFVLAKVAALALVTVAGTVVAAAVAAGVGAVAFGGRVPVAAFAASTGLWLVAAVALVCVGVAASCVFASPTAAIGLSVVVALLTPVAAVWEPAARRSPAGLNGVIAEAAAGGQPAWAWPVATTLVAAALVTAAGVAAYRRREIG